MFNEESNCYESKNDLTSGISTLFIDKRSSALIMSAWIISYLPTTEVKEHGKTNLLNLFDTWVVGAAAPHGMSKFLKGRSKRFMRGHKWVGNTFGPTRAGNVAVTIPLSYRYSTTYDKIKSDVNYSRKEKRTYFGLRVLGMMPR